MAIIDSVKLPDNSTYEVADNHSGYQKQTLTTPLTINGTQETTVEGTLGALNTYSDKIKDNLIGRNLIDNGWFTVNQRGATTVTIDSQYGADRWYKDGGTSLTFSTGQVIITSAICRQKFENQLSNGAYTASVLLSDGTIYSGTAIKSNDTNVIEFLANASIRLIYNASTKAFGIDTANIGGVTTSIRAVKLELGSISTLANDVAPDYALELAKCQTSTADPSDTYANQGDIAVTSELSGRNLLDNGWFTVNQRGVTSGNFVTAYYMDRWRATYSYNFNDSSWSLTSGVLTSTAPSDSPVFWTQIFENPSMLNGKVLTASVLLSNGTIVSGTITRANGTSQTFIHNEDYDIFIHSTNVFHFKIWEGKTVAIKALKLELGTVSTLANDVEPNYTTELLKCQREFYRKISKDNTNAYIASGICTSSIGFIFTMKLPCEMKSAPSISFAGSFYITNGLINVAVTSFSVAGFSGDTMGIVAVTSGGLTTGDGALIYANNLGDYIDFTT